MERTFVIGIAGGSGSGKSTLVEQIMCSEFAAHVSLLPHDAYYLNGHQMPPEVRKDENWDHPAALDNALLTRHVARILDGHPIDRPVYNFGTHSRTAKVERVEPRSVLLIEGILIFAIPELRDLMQLRVFVDTPPEERIVRRMLRDTKERSRTVESVAAQFRNTVRPMHDKYVEPSRVHAHVVIPWDWAGDSRPAVEMLLARIGRHALTQAD
ncbi:MAG: uridine kinase [Gemmataceae bacterium]|nr:uridine kinase [Gemmataceae bacterium]